MVTEVMATHDLSQRRACELIGITRHALRQRGRRHVVHSFNDQPGQSRGLATPTARRALLLSPTLRRSLR
jgi:hypothetical protein